MKRILIGISIVVVLVLYGALLLHATREVEKWLTLARDEVEQLLGDVGRLSGDVKQLTENVEQLSEGMATAKAMELEEALFKI